MYPYVRKTRDEFQLHQKTPSGWEEVTAYNTYKEALQGRREYRENQPEYEIRIRLKRVKLGESNNGK